MFAGNYLLIYLVYVTAFKIVDNFKGFQNDVHIIGFVSTA